MARDEKYRSRSVVEHPQSVEIATTMEAMAIMFAVRRLSKPAEIVNSANRFMTDASPAITRSGSVLSTDLGHVVGFCGPSHPSKG